MTRFHTDEYIDFLYRVTPENMEQQQLQQLRCEYWDSSLQRLIASQRRRRLPYL